MEFQRDIAYNLLLIKKKLVLNLLINCISARSAPQLLSIKDECTFLFLKFLIIGLCNSSANSLFEIFSFLTVPAEVFYQKICRTFKQFHVDIHHILEF